MPQAQPENSNTVTPYFILKNADQAIDFYKYVLNAKEEFRMDTPDGKVMHASMRIGDSEIMMTEQYAPMSAEITKSSTYVFIDDPDAALERARERDEAPGPGNVLKGSLSYGGACAALSPSCKREA